MTDDESVAKWVAKLLELDEAIFLVYFHQNMEKERKKYWHDMHIRTKTFVQGDQVFLYGCKYQRHRGKL
jgi:hypothetical protein